MKRQVIQGLLTREDVSKLANVCKHTVARDVRAGLLLERRFNRRRLRYAAEDVIAYLAAKGLRQETNQTSLSHSVALAACENAVLDETDNHVKRPKTGYEAVETGVLEAQNPKNIGKSKKNPQKQAPQHIMRYETRPAENPVFQGFEELSSESWLVLNRFGTADFSYFQSTFFGGRFSFFRRFIEVANALN